MQEGDRFEWFKSQRGGSFMAILTGKIFDSATGDTVEARVQVIGPAGDVIAPINAMWKVGPGEPFFYSDGEFSLDVPRGNVQISVERGTEYTPWRKTVEAGTSSVITLDIELDRWSDLPDLGWHPGNTHIHYDETEGDPDRRLRYDSRVEDLRMTAVSILQRRELLYATNKYPPGMLNEFTDTHHYVQQGEETRHNIASHDVTGYGHVMLLNLRNLVEPISRGLLVDPFAPDYPPLTYACNDAREQGGLVIWCHNGRGMEAPIAAALGKLDAMNLFDPYWVDVEYDLWYRMLNTGARLPASTGSDWFVCSANRVYTQSEPKFTYKNWLGALRAGRTFITNGPALSLSVNGLEPGSTVNITPGEVLQAEINWQSHYGVSRVELIQNGSTVATREFPKGSRKDSFTTDITANTDGWMAARLGSGARDSFGQAIWAHTSPVYINAENVPSAERDRDARWLVNQIDESLSWISTGAKFYTDTQRKEVLDLFGNGRDVYVQMTTSRK